MNKIPRMITGFFVLMLLHISVYANSSTVYKQTSEAGMEQVYAAVYKSLEDARFYVVFEPNIGKNLQGFSQKWGKKYNQNKLESIRSMVFCNGWYANAVSNADPDMLALCPLRVGLYEKDGKTSVLFARPTVIAAQSAAKNVLQEVESAVIEAIKQAIDKVNKNK